MVCGISVMISIIGTLMYTCNDINIFALIGRLTNNYCDKEQSRVKRRGYGPSNNRYLLETSDETYINFIINFQYRDSTLIKRVLYTLQFIYTHNNMYKHVSSMCAYWHRSIVYGIAIGASIFSWFAVRHKTDWIYSKWTNLSAQE